MRARAGAGKSTLLDTLAMQLPEGTVTGDITVNGQHMSRTMFRSISTYVPQVGAQTRPLLVEEAHVKQSQEGWHA